MMNKTKKKNVYVKYAVIMCISGALGGILGGVMEMGQVHGVLTGIQEGMQFFLNSVRTWMLPLMAICGVIALVLCEQYMGRLKRAAKPWNRQKMKRMNGWITSWKLREVGE